MVLFQKTNSLSQLDQDAKCQNGQDANEKERHTPSLIKSKGKIGKELCIERMTRTSTPATAMQ
jgi:hypothetical protein